jgi:outer membrane protein with beta-barrel domain
MPAFAGRLLAPLMMLGFSASAAVAQIPVPSVNATAFASAAMAPDARTAVGIGVGALPRPGPVSFEFEYCRRRGDPTAGEPDIVTFAGNVLIQVPVRPRLQVYGTLGVGFYYLQSDLDTSEANDGRNFGGGLKLTLAGPLKMRIDYRTFLLAPIEGQYRSNVHRLSFGLVAGF